MLRSDDFVSGMQISACVVEQTIVRFGTNRWFAPSEWNVLGYGNDEYGEFFTIFVNETIEAISGLCNHI